MYKNVLKRAVAMTTICAMAVAGMYIPEKRVNAAEVIDTSDWQKSIVVDFGVTSDLDAEGNQIPGLCEESQIQLKQVLGEVETAVPVEGRGNWLYENTTIQDVYGTTALVKQKMGFDKVMPAGITSTGGNYFKDWVFSPDGEEYSFSVDLPVGQYYVAVYTGNKVKNYDNTTFVRFNDESFMMGETEFPVVYDQTSAGGSQFYGETKKELVYVVDVKDNGQGYGTLKATFFDDTNYESVPGLKISDIDAVYEDGVQGPGIKLFDFYTGTDYEIDKEAIYDKYVAARLNGFEIIPVENPVPASEMKIEDVKAEFLDVVPATVSTGVENTTDRIYYASSNPEVITVNPYTGEGTVHHWTGTATVYAYNVSSGLLGKAEYTAIPQNQIDLSNEEMVLILDDKEEYSVGELISRFNNAEEDIIDWQLSKEGVITLSEPEFLPDNEQPGSKVNINAVGVGSVIVKAVRKDSSEHVKECLVTVLKATKGVKLVDKDGKDFAENDVITINEGESVDIGAVISPEDASEKGMNFSSADASVAKVTSNGDKATITGVAPGETTITVKTAYTEDINASIKVVVKAVPKPEPTATPAPGNTTPGGNNTVAPGQQETSSTTVNQTTDSTDKEINKVTLSGKKTTTLKLKKSATFKIKAAGSKVKKVKCTVKSGKKFVKVTTTKKAVKIKAKKRGTAKLVIKVTTKDKKTVTFKRTIKVK